MARGDAHYDQPFITAKWATLAMSCLTTLLGGAMIGLGIYALLNPLGSALVPMTLPIIIIATGTAVFLLSLLGCFGSAMEHRKSLWVYFSVMLLLVILQFAIGIAALTNRGDAVNTVLEKRWDYLYENNPRHIRDIEDMYECCGLTSLTDRAWPKHGKTCQVKFGYTRACIQPIKAEFDDRQEQFGIGVLTLAALQLLGLIPTLYLAKRIPSPEEYESSLIEEHRRLLNDSSNRPLYGGPGSAAANSNIQHPAGGPAGAFSPQNNRPGSRTA